MSKYLHFLNGIINCTIRLCQVPIHYRSPTICQLAVKSDKYALKHVPTYIMNENICETGMKINGLNLYYVPPFLKTVNVCMTAVKQNGLALECVPEPIKTYNVCLQAVKVSGGALCYVPRKFKDERLCTVAILQNIKSFKHMKNLDQDLHDKMSKIVVDDGYYELLSNINNDVYQYVVEYGSIKVDL